MDNPLNVDLLPLRMLLLTDTHGSVSVVETIRRLRSEVDLVIHAGDFTDFGRFSEHFFEVTQELELPVLFVSGNHESPYLCEDLSQDYNATCCDDRILDCGKVQFIGVPGYNLFAREREECIRSLLEMAENAPGKPTILLSHVPPSPWLYRKSDHGDGAITMLINILSPPLVVCGHFHERETRVEQIGTSTVVNPGRSGAVVTITPNYQIEVLPVS